MAADVSKHLDRAKRFLEKNRVEDAIEAYLAVLDEAPQHQEATQALGDLYARMDQPDRAAVYYGLLFDLLVEPKDESKALAIYNRFLKAGRGQQPPERIARYAFLQQKQNHPDEAVEQYTKAAELFAAANREEDALFCWERIAQLDPENLSRQLRLAEAAERIGKNALAVRAFLRAGQLASASGPRPTRCTCWAARTNSRRRSAASDCCMPKPICKPGMRCVPQRCWNPLLARKVTQHFSPRIATR